MGYELGLYMDQLFNWLSDYLHLRCLKKKERKRDEIYLNYSRLLRYNTIKAFIDIFPNHFFNIPFVQFNI